MSDTPTRIEALRERIRQDSPEVTRRIREAADANLGNEARFRTLFAKIIEPWAEALDIPLLVREERTLATGRADATYNRLIIEYEAPGRLRNNIHHGPTAHAIQQAKDYVDGVARQERQQVHRLIGVALDGCYFIYVRRVDDNWTDPEVEPVNEQSVARFLRLLVSLTSGKALLPENLVQDFGSNTIYAQRVASSLYKSLGQALDDGRTDLVDKLFEQWKTFFGQVTGYDEQSHPLRNRPELREFARGMGINPRDVDPPRLFFTVHTYFALLIKLIAYYSLSRFVSGFGTRFGSMYQLDDDSLRREMEELEHGGIFRTLGIRNFLEGDFFKWYLQTWDDEVARAVRTLLERLKDYDPGTLEVSPEQARDLLKKLYHRLMPREIRHDLGEYYTPDWLAEHVLDELGYEGQTDKRLLDPACGSGTFLVLAMKRLKDRCLREGLNEQETLETILNSIVGIDLNPLAAIAARTNYLLALGDLMEHRTREIDLPVYLADSILTPSAGRQLFNKDRYEITTVVGQFDIPSCLTSRSQIDALCNMLEECVGAGVEVGVFLARSRRALAIPEQDWSGGGGRGVGAEAILSELYDKLASLHRQGLDGIWARILQNAFMPLFIGRFDFVAGNPPWVNWESLPAQYKRQVAPLWEQHQLFPHRGFRAILGGSKDDVSVLMSYVALEELCEPDGTLGFLITQSVFKATGGGQGFRRFRLGDGTPIEIVRAEDMSDFQPFEGATNRTAAFYARKGRETSYPVQYTVWQKVVRGAIEPSMPLTEVRARLRRLDYRAIPVDPNDATSAWLTGRAAAIASVQHLCKPSSLTPRKGIFASVNGVFWVTPVHERPDGVLVAQNYVQGARRAVRQLMADLEPELVFPMLRGRDVRRWSARPSLHIIVTHRREAGLAAIPEREMQTAYPRTWAYLKQFESELKTSGLFKRYFMRKQQGRTVETGPFYSMFNVGPYTFSQHKVVFREISSSLTCAVVSSDDSAHPIIPDHKLVLIPTNSEAEAHYICGVLNSTIVGFFALSYAISTQFSTHLGDYLSIPAWNPLSSAHQAIAARSRLLHQAALLDEPLVRLEGELDNDVATLLEISQQQLAEIRESYLELTKFDLRSAAPSMLADDDDKEDEESE